jgi:hypothetical protein
MNQDSNLTRLRELLWRRELSEVERGELRELLAANPETDWGTEEQLTRLIDQLPDAPVASNFTARVMQAVELEEQQGSRRGTNWKALFPRIAFAGAAVFLGVFVLLRDSRSNQFRDSLIVIAEVESPPNLTSLEDFDVINRLGNKSPVDEELLALLQ